MQEIEDRGGEVEFRSLGFEMVQEVQVLGQKWLSLGSGQCWLGFCVRVRNRFISVSDHAVLHHKD